MVLFSLLSISALATMANFTTLDEMEVRSDPRNELTVVGISVNGEVQFFCDQLMFAV